MGMDVYGKANGKPPRPGKDGYSDAFWKKYREWKERSGSYFRASVWTWHPLWELCTHFAPEICAKVQHGHTNDGDGLNGPDSRALALILAQQEDEIRKYLGAMQATRDSLPDEECFCCGGTGRRAEPPVTGPGPLPCNGCGGNRDEDKPGTGKVRPHETHYHTSIEEVREFAAFLRDCGGFEIH